MHATAVSAMCGVKDLDPSRKQVVGDRHDDVTTLMAQGDPSLHCVMHPAGVQTCLACDPVDVMP